MNIKSGRRLGKAISTITKLDVWAVQASPEEVARYIGMLASYSFVKTVEGVTASVLWKDQLLQVRSVTPSTAIRELTTQIDAIDTVLARARVYPKAKNRIAVHIWHKDVTVLKNVVKVFGGNYYRQGSGLVWICSKRSVLERMWCMVGPLVSDDNNTLGLLKEMFDGTSNGR